jgi:hypothetical protein
MMVLKIVVSSSSLQSTKREISWSEGGRTLVDIFNLNHKIQSSLSEYFFSKNNIAEVHREVLVLAVIAFARQAVLTLQT